MAAFLDAVGPEANPPVIAEGGFLSVLHRARSELRPDLIALGQHGRSGLFHALIALISPVALILASKWMTGGMKQKHGD